MLKWLQHRCSEFIRAGRRYHRFYRKIFFNGKDGFFVDAEAFAFMEHKFPGDLLFVSSQRISLIIITFKSSWKKDVLNLSTFH